MKKSIAAVTLVLACLTTACATSSVSPPARPETPVGGEASPQTATLEVQQPASAPLGEMAAPTEGPQSTSTVNPRLHATNPQGVKLASGDQPTLVEFFAFW
jgi:hypothetical protein